MPIQEVSIAELGALEAKTLQVNIAKFPVCYAFANNSLSVISTGITGYGESRRAFGSYLSQIVVNLSLALLSALRQHNTQVYSNLRHALEHTALAAYALAHPEDEYFTADQSDANHGKFMRDTVYGWLDEKYPHDSTEITRLKKLINKDHAHASLTHAYRNLQRVDGEILTVQVDFIDRHESHSIAADLIHIGHIGIVVMDTILSVVEHHPFVRAKKGAAEDRINVLKLRDPAHAEYEYWDQQDRLRE